MLRETVDRLEMAINALIVQTDQSIWDKDKQSFRFSLQSPQVVQLCKVIRMVSGLNACLTLHPRAQYADILMLVRDVADFLSEIAFLHEGFQSRSPTADQQRFVEHFFEEYSDGCAADIIANPPRGSVVERKKIQAAQARLLIPDNPHDTQKKGLAIDAVMSGYMHGSYQSAMELYEDGTYRFRLNGLTNSPRAREAECQIVLNVHHVLNILKSVAWSMQNVAVFDSLQKVRIEFEQTAACEGMNFAVPLEAPAKDAV